LRRLLSAASASAVLNALVAAAAPASQPARVNAARRVNLKSFMPS
jgi:hypothetical protein